MMKDDEGRQRSGVGGLTTGRRKEKRVLCALCERVEGEVAAPSHGRSERGHERGGLDV